MKDLNTRNRPEILAPAGSYDAMKAAVAAGTDAVYLGGTLFSARAFAGNFTEEELLQTIDYCHLFDVKVYMTVNTLFKGGEIEQLASFMLPYYEGGVDAVLVQDAGAAAILKDRFPDLPLHASTQMSISSSYGASYLKELGFSRVVPARELSLRELKEIREKVDIELETFVHGAMCYAYSGKCLFSSFMGGRSGNRGRCAQPCRQRYDLSVNGKQKEAHIMSLKDMCTLELLPELIDAGIDSFKIEGRMKNPEYVAAAVQAYAAQRDQYLEMRDVCGKGYSSWTQKQKEHLLKVSDERTKELKDIYNRGGFCDGYYVMEKGPEMFASDRPNHAGLLIGSVKKVAGPEVLIRLKEEVHAQDVLEIREAGVELTSPVSGKEGALLTLKGKELRKIHPGMEVYRTRNNHLLSGIREEILEKERTINVKAAVKAKEGQALSVRISDDCVQIETTGSIVQKSERQPVTKERLAEKMNKTKGSCLTLDSTYDVDENVFVSMSEFNSLRREAMDAFKKARTERFHRDGSK